MTLFRQLIEVVRAIAWLLWLIVRQLAVRIGQALRYLYEHRVVIAHHRLTVPALVTASVVWSGFALHRAYHDQPAYEGVAPLSAVDVSANTLPETLPVIRTTFPSNTHSNMALVASVYGWLGTPHRTGGRSKSGTDCSAFVQAVYREAYQIPLSRSSEAMHQYDVEPIAQEELREGDLVFFRIGGKRISHVGIYLRNGLFAHASSSRGVIMDALHDPYFAKRYVAGGRVKGVDRE